MLGPCLITFLLTPNLVSGQSLFGKILPSSNPTDFVVHFGRESDSDTFCKEKGGDWKCSPRGSQCKATFTCPPSTTRPQNNLCKTKAFADCEPDPQYYNKYHPDYLCKNKAELEKFPVYDCSSSGLSEDEDLAEKIKDYRDFLADNCQQRSVAPEEAGCVSYYMFSEEALSRSYQVSDSFDSSRCPGERPCLKNGNCCRLRLRRGQFVCPRNGCSP